MSISRDIVLRHEDVFVHLYRVYQFQIRQFILTDIDRGLYLWYLVEYTDKFTISKQRTHWNLMQTTVNSRRLQYNILYIVTISEQKCPVYGFAIKRRGAVTILFEKSHGIIRIFGQFLRKPPMYNRNRRLSQQYLMTSVL